MDYTVGRITQLTTKPLSLFELPIITSEIIKDVKPTAKGKWSSRKNEFGWEVTLRSEFNAISRIILHDELRYLRNKSHFVKTFKREMLLDMQFIIDSLKNKRNR